MNAEADRAAREPITAPALRAMKGRGEKIAMLTAYDASFARRIEAAGVDAILVGDSLGMVVQGHETTLPVTMDDIVYHTRNVARGCRRALLIADLPFMSCATPEQALTNAARLIQEGGARMVKLEGGGAQAETVRQLTACNIPVCAHVGLQPQAIHRLGGYCVQGRDAASARAIRQEAHLLQEAGAALLVLECVPAALAAEIAATLEIPTIGIGAGAACDGQVLVLYDLLGITPDARAPRFARNFIVDAGSVPAALEAFVRAVKSGEFPAAEHAFS